jgi:hypothetical protein
MKTLNAFYDLDVGPVSYDFIVFLIKAELERRRIGADKLHVVIVPGEGPGGMRDKSNFYDQHEAKFRLWNICIPACALINASVTMATGWLQAEIIGRDHSSIAWPIDWDHQTLRTRPHLIGGIVQAAHAGISIPRLGASAHAIRTVKKLFGGRPIVTMTERNTYFGPRNTVATEWREAQKYISSKGFAVVNIKDVSAALAQGGGFAELSVDLRMAMYQESALNLQANNGSASLCWFSDKPYAMFDAGVGEAEQEWRGLFVDEGVPWGASWPWATPKQRIVYRRSTRDVIIEEFERGLG